MGVFVLSLAIASYAALCYNGVYRSIQSPSYPATMLIQSHTLLHLEHVAVHSLTQLLSDYYKEDSSKHGLLS